MSNLVLSKNDDNKRTKNIKKVFKKIIRDKVLYIMMLPAMIYYFVFKYLPMYGVIIAFKDFNINKGILHSPFADPWFKHFQMFFDSPYWKQLLGNTMIISVSKLALGTIASLFLAIIINECRISWFKKGVQTFTYIPHFLSWVIIYGMAIAFFSQDGGIINKWIEQLGLSSIPFLTSTKYFRSVLIGTHIWHSAGWGAIIYLAAISGISPSLYEAATVDGASRLKKIWYVTLPSIRSTIIILLILNIGKIMNAGFEQIYVMYNVQVYEVADIIDTWVYRTGLGQLNFSLASAVGLLKSGIGVILVVTTNRIAKKWGESMW